MSCITNTYICSIKFIILVSLATLISCDAPPTTTAQTTYLNQGWDQKERLWWYRTSQGSRLLPLSWMQALEQKNSPKKFLSRQNFLRLGYLPDEAGSNEMPLGFRD